MNVHVLRALVLLSVLVLTVTGCGEATERIESPADDTAPVAMTWLGVTNWLVQYGETTVLFDAYFKRPESDDESNEVGMDIFRDILAAKSIGSIDYIFVGHSHFDHVIDAAPAALLTGAQVIGSATTCLITQAQGLPESRCTVVGQGDRLEVGDAEVRVVRTIHWFPFVSSIGGFDVLTEVPALDEIQSAPNGGALSFLFTFPGAERRSFFMQGSLADLMATDGSDQDYVQNLESAFADIEGDVLWIGTGNFLNERAEMEPYLERIRPKWVIPHHWDPLSPALRTGLMMSFTGQDWYADTLSAAGAELVIPQQYFDEFIMDGEGVRRLEASSIPSAMAFTGE